MSRHLNEQLIDAACKGNTVTIKKLIASGADPNYRNTQINTPLMWAATHRHLDSAQVLLESGADVNGQDVLGGTALMVAAANGDLPMLEKAFAAGGESRATSAEKLWSCQEGTERLEFADRPVSRNDGADVCPIEHTADALPR